MVMNTFGVWKCFTDSKWVKQFLLSAFQGPKGPTPDDQYHMSIWGSGPVKRLSE